ncbi:MAG: glutamate 5-kinase [Candidatus Omnitrophica bacterium]|nr:glutamate 5-kinase [Candidatus Omnitrophota bacterium]
MRQLQKEYKRIVVKIGASLIYQEKTGFDEPRIREIVSEIAQLATADNQIIVVSSGAIALGMSILRLHSRPKELSVLQAAAAIGQHELMGMYRMLFKEKGLSCAQLLLTWEDFANRKRYLNAKNTLSTLIKFGCIPIINENDTVATEEIKFGDNDCLSALVATLINADLLIMLSDVDGLLDNNKKVVQVVEKITPQIKALACPTNKRTCVGGMVTKIKAAEIVTASGIPCIIANGRKKNIIQSCLSEQYTVGTIFLPKVTSLTARKRWIGFGAKSKGRVIVDDGAKKAILNNKSLLSVGVLGLHGDFESGDIVSICDKECREFARGKVTVTARQLESIRGRRFENEIVHRDNIVVL